MNLEEIVTRHSPPLLIYEETYDAEREVRREVGEMLQKRVAFSLWDHANSPTKKFEIGLNSIVLFLAEDFAHKATELKSTVLIKKEHFEDAINYVRNLMSSSGEFLLLLEEWERAVARFLSIQRSKTTKREAIFRTCEQFKIDLLDFTQIFPQLPP